MIAETEPTCTGKQILHRKGITLKKCKEIADTKEKANFIWYAPQKMPNPRNPSFCALYEECDIKKKARFPHRHGFTLKRL